jgi:hypothetical protein
MPAPRRIARFNKHFTNRLTLRVAGYLPGFAIVSHVGRKSGRPYLRSTERLGEERLGGGIV